MASMDVWTYRQPTWTQNDLTGFDVEAVDGSIGKVDEATTATDSSYLVVDTGPWIFGKKVMLPAGVIETIDLEYGADRRGVPALLAVTAAEAE